METDKQTPMDFASVEEVQDVVGAEIELSQDGDLPMQKYLKGNPSSSFPEHYHFLENSSDEDDIPCTSQSFSDSLKDNCVCWECGEHFPFLDKLMEHFRRHKAEVRCHLCQVTFTRIISLAMHLDNAHHDEDLFCPKCKEHFKNPWHLNEHLEKHHIEQKEDPNCEERSTALEQEAFQENAEEIEIGNKEVEVQGPEVVIKTETEDSMSDVEKELKEEKIENTSQRTCPFNESQGCDLSHMRTVLSNEDCSFLVAKDHPYARTNKAPTITGKGTPGYVLRSMRYTTTVTEVFSRKSGPDSGVQKKIRVFFLHSAPKKDGNNEMCKSSMDKTKELISQEMQTTQIKENSNLKQEISTSSALPVQLSPSSEAKPSMNFKLKPEDQREEDISHWECAPIQCEDELTEEVAEEEEAEEDVQEEELVEENVIQSDDEEDDDDSLPPGDSVYVPDEDMNSDSDSGSSDGFSGRDSEDETRRRRPRIRKDRRAEVKRSGPNNFVKQFPSTCGKAQSKSSEMAFNSQTCHRCGAGPFPDLKSHMNQCFTCVVCRITCDSRVMLLNHLALAHPGAVYTCSDCLEHYPDQDSYKNHVCRFKACAGSKTVFQGVQSCPPVSSTYVAPTSGAGSAEQSVSGTSCSRNLTALPISGPILVPCNGKIQIINPLQTSTALSRPSFAIVPGPLSSSSSTTSSSSVGPVPVMATMVLSGGTLPPRVKHMVLSGCQSTTPTKTLHMQLINPTQTKIITHPAPKPTANLLLQGKAQSQTIVRPHGNIPLASGCRPVSPVVPLSVPSVLTPAATVSKQTQVKIGGPPTPKSNITGSPLMTPIRFPTPALVSADNTNLVQTPRQTPVVNVQTNVHLPVPTQVPSTGPSVAPVGIPVPVPASVRLLPPPCPVSPNQKPSHASGPLQIVAMFVNQSQKLALQRRLKKSWRSKAIFICRHCGAISRQPSLGVRHRYLHRGSRRHRCHCGRTFQHQLHLLRHQVQHAEAVRYVCAPCGETFDGALLLMRHKQGLNGREPANRQPRRECRVPFACDCGQIFVRPSALLWHKLKNSKQFKHHRLRQGRTQN